MTSHSILTDDNDGLVDCSERIESTFARADPGVDRQHNLAIGSTGADDKVSGNQMEKTLIEVYLPAVQFDDEPSALTAEDDTRLADAVSWVAELPETASLARGVAGLRKEIRRLGE